MTTTAAVKPQSAHKTLRDFRESSGTLFAKNTTRDKITCFTDKVSFELDPIGEPGSMAIMPKECLDVPGFQRLWYKKKIVISDDPEMENEIVLMLGNLVDVGTPKVSVMDFKTGQMSQVGPTLEEPSNRKDFTMAVDADGQPITQKCLIGGESIFLSQQQQMEGFPPLCADHQSESFRVVSTPMPDGTWKHVLADLPSS